jgi:hypothetical protein
MRRRAASMSIRPLMMKPSRKISFRRATRAQSILFDTECPGPVVSATESRSGPGPSAREQGTRVPPLAVMNSTVKHSAQHVGGSWPRFNEPGVTGVISSALGVCQLCLRLEVSDMDVTSAMTGDPAPCVQLFPFFVVRVRSPARAGANTPSSALAEQTTYTGYENRGAPDTRCSRPASR